MCSNQSNNGNLLHLNIVHLPFVQSLLMISYLQITVDCFGIPAVNGGHLIMLCEVHVF